MIRKENFLNFLNLEEENSPSFILPWNVLVSSDWLGFFCLFVCFPLPSLSQSGKEVFILIALGGKYFSLGICGREMYASALVNRRLS